MIDIFFYLFVVCILLILGFGLKKDSPAFVGLASILFITLGLILFTGGSVDRINGYVMTVDGNTTAFDLNYSNYTMFDITCPENVYCEPDHFVHISGLLFFYGGFVVLVMAFVTLFRSGKEEEEKEKEKGVML